MPQHKTLTQIFPSLQANITCCNIVNTVIARKLNWLLHTNARNCFSVVCHW